MTLRRPTASFRSFLLFFPGLMLGVTQCSNADEAISEAVPRGVVVDDADEPQANLKEAQPSPFRPVSRMVRKTTSDPLVELCKETVEVTSRRMLSTDLHTPWQMIHALLGLRNDFRMLHNGEQINGLDWIAEGQTYENEYWFERTKHGGRAHPYSRPYAFEGHANQTIALISMSGVELDREFGTAGGSVTMRDMIRHAQMTISPKDEPTWTLWALSRYLPPSARWQSEDGQEWSIEKLMQVEVGKPERGAPCGGTHGLFALAHARNVYLQQGKPLRGVWLQAEYKIRKYINTARMQQNSNGSLSSNYFRGREYNPDFNKRMASVGHVLEFLMIALPQNELNSQWVRRAVHSAATELMNNRKAYVKCSPLYHTVNALNIYLDRVNPAEPVEMAVKPGRRTVQVDEPQTNKVPIKTVSQPKVVAEAPKTEVTPAPEMKPAPIDITPKNDIGSTELKVEDTPPKPIAEQGEWKATPQERREVIDVPDNKVGGAESSSDADVKHEKPTTDAVPAEAAALKLPTADAPKKTKEEAVEKTTELPAATALTVPAAEQTPVVEIPKAEPSETPEPQPETVEPSAVPPVVKEPVTEGPADGSLMGLVVPAAPVAESVVTVTDPSLGLSADRTETALTPVPDSLTTVDAGTTSTLSAASAMPAQTAASAYDAIVAAMEIREGMSVAEVGSGDGLFVHAISKAVGEKGSFFAIDSSAEMVEQLESMVEQDKLSNVYVVRNDDETLQLMTRRVEIVLLCDTYQKLKQPVSIVSSVQRTLKPGGDFVLVESRNLDQTERNAIINAVTESGLDFVSDMSVPGFESGTFLRFRRAF